jgi:spoIIIJ-associated protein
MDVTEKWGDDIESAVELALIDLEATRDQVDVKVLERPSRGFFGIGSRLALVRVSRKPEFIAQPEPEPIPEKTEPKKGKKENRSNSKGKRDKKNKKADAQKAKPAAAEKKELKDEKDVKENKKAAEEKKSDEPKKKANGKRGKKHEKRSNAGRKDNYESKLPELDFHKVMDKLPISEDHPALLFLKDVTNKMGLNLNMVCRADESSVLIEISGPDTSTIIGKHGQTLDAIQYLTSLVVNKDRKDYIKVVIDAENYRSRREKTLEQLAERLARKVVRTGRQIKLEPMIPYERKIIHSTLQQNPDVVTRSEGQDPYRKVVIELKKDK